jgi:biofilm PGA synthesis N-glycosyltransferase PgaC
MISCIITAFKEHKSIGMAITSMEKSCEKANQEYEILVLAPDKETLEEAMFFSNKKIRVIQDRGKGKPCALNLAFQEARGDIFILTDGDVYVNQYAVRELLKRLTKDVYAISGRPKSISPRNTMLGYWSHLLADMADLSRKKAKGSFVCSGYLYLLRSNLIKEIPEDCLSDDAYISYKVIEKGKKIDYAPEAHVFVKYPDNFKDWMAQKKRSTGGYVQLEKEYNLKSIKEMRSIKQEMKGIFDVLGYPLGLKEFVWTINLILARIWLWINIFWERKVLKKDFNKTWTRVVSTK